MNESNSSSSEPKRGRRPQGPPQSDSELQQHDSQRADAARSNSPRSTSLQRRRARRPAGPPQAAESTQAAGPKQGSVTSSSSEPAVWVSTNSTDVFSKSDSSGVAAVDISQASRAGTAKRSRGNRVAVVLALIVAAVLVIAGAATAAVLGVKEHSLSSRQQQCDRYAAFARQVIVNLTSLNPDNIDQAVTNFQKTTSGKALEQSQDLLKQAGGLIKSQKLSTQGVVISSAINTCDSDATSVLLVSGWHMKNPETKTDDVQTFRWKVQISTLNGEPRATDVQWVV